MGSKPIRKTRGSRHSLQAELLQLLFLQFLLTYEAVVFLLYATAIIVALLTFIFGDALQLTSKEWVSIKNALRSCGSVYL